MSLEGPTISLPEIGTWAFYAKEASWNYPCLVIDRDNSDNRKTGQTCSLICFDLASNDCEQVLNVKKKNIWLIEDAPSKQLADSKIESAKRIYSAKKPTPLNQKLTSNSRSKKYKDMPVHKKTLNHGKTRKMMKMKKTIKAILKKLLDLVIV